MKTKIFPMFLPCDWHAFVAIYLTMKRLRQMVCHIFYDFMTIIFHVLVTNLLYFLTNSSQKVFRDAPFMTMSFFVTGSS
jgi:hypothetical protein